MREDLINTDSLKTGLVILETVRIPTIPGHCAIDLIKDLLAAREEIAELKKRLTKPSSFW